MTCQPISQPKQTPTPNGSACFPGTVSVTYCDGDAWVLAGERNGSRARLADVLVFRRVLRAAQAGAVRTMPEMAGWAHRLQSSIAAVCPAVGEPLDYGHDRCERVGYALQRVSNLLQLVAARALAAKSMAEHDKVSAGIFEHTGGASAVFRDRRDTFVSMAVRVQGAAGHAGRP